ncbi:hypothetical protein [Limnoraphis robusta]|nr:hypothetical protein [Limnoraphis robusta]
MGFEVIVGIQMLIKRTVIATAPDDFGEKVKHACETSQLPIGDICRIAGISREFLHAVTINKYPHISEDKFNALCYALEKKPEDFGVRWEDAVIHRPDSEKVAQKLAKRPIEKPIDLAQMHHILKLNQQKPMRLTESLIRAHIAKGDFEEWSKSVCGVAYRAYQLEKHYPWRFEKVEAQSHATA